jgi:putative colanic acid biosynthesis UDP-glucose lipid carrier transferase
MWLCKIGIVRTSIIRLQHTDDVEMQQKFNSRVGLFSAVLDALFVGWSLWLLAMAFGTHWDKNYSLSLVSAVGLFFFFAQSQDLYRSWRGAAMKQEVMRIWLAWFWVVLVLLLLTYATKTTTEYSRRVILVWFTATPLLLIVWRMVMRLVLGMLRERNINNRNVAIAGASENGVHVAQMLLGSPWMGLHPVGFFDDREQTGSRPLPSPPVQVLGTLDDLVELARKGDIDLIYITLPLRAEERIRQLISRLSQTTASVYVIPEFFVSDLMNLTWSNIGDLPAISVFETPFFGVDGWLKNAEDLILGSIILIVVFIPMVIISIGVKLSSPGPIFFRQTRYGLRGEKIEVWKFRTMNVCENGDEVKQATRNDPRVTKFGSFLRKTSLDELPQFINVLQGSMSIVGPRPHAVAHNEQYRKIIDGYMLRHKVKPGITGLAQVNGWRGEIDSLDKMQKRIECDLAYMRNWSLWLDIRIIFRTIIKEFAGENAY